MPYVAMASIRVDNDKDDDGMLVALDLKNYGTGAAYSVTVTWVPVFNGAVLKPEEPSAPVSFLMPPGSTHSYGHLPIMGERYRNLMDLKTTFTMSIDITFTDAAGRAYHTHYVTDHKPSGIREPGPLHHLWLTSEEWCKDDRGRPCGAGE